MSLKRAFRRLAAPAGAVIIGATAVVSISTAHAAVIGGLSIDPSPTGTDTSAITVTTSAACPSGTNLIGIVTGSGFPAAGQNVVPNSSLTAYPTAVSGGYIVPLQNTLQSFGNAQTPPVVFSGKYDITITCRNAFGASTFGDFVGSLWFTGPHAYQTTDPNAPTPTATSLAATPSSPQIAGTNVTFNALVSPNAAGTVKFMDGATQVGATQNVTSVSGAASVSTTTLSVGSHSLTAVFTPTNAGAFAASTSAAVPYTINSAPVATPTSTALSASPASPQVVGTNVTLNALVTPNAAGTVKFMDGATQVGATQNVTSVSGAASVSTTALAVGGHSFTAVFTPTNPTAFAGSTSSTLSYTINPAPTATSTSLSASPASPQIAGTNVTLNALVSPNAAGTVKFMDGATQVGATQNVTSVSGAASVSTTALAVGGHSFTAVFTPTSPTAFAGSTSSAVPYTINPVPTATATSTSLSASPASPQLAGTNVTLNALVSPNAAGTVKFMDGATQVGATQNVTSVSGAASVSSSALAVGGHSFKAVFTPTDPTAFTGSTSSAVPYTINPVPTATATSTSLSATPVSPQLAGTNVTLNALVSPNAAGTVKFMDGATQVGATQNVTSVSGAASVSSSALAVGGHSFTAVFTPTDPTAFVGSTSSAVPYTINPVPTATATSTSLSATPASPQLAGTNVTLNALVSPNAAGTVKFMDGATQVGATQNVTSVSGAASVSSSALAVGGHSFTAVFTPTDPTAFAGSTSAAVPYTINSVVTVPTPTATAVTASPASPQIVGTNVTISALVSPAAAGTVKFMDGATQVGATQNVTSISGAASMSTSALAVGGHSFSAVFTPTDPTAFAPSTSGAVGYTINSASGVTSTATVLTASPPSPHVVGTNITLAALVTPAADGTVTFMDGGSQLGAIQSVTSVSGAASISTTSLGIGMHSLTAVFTPANPTAFSGSTSAALSYKINKAARPLRTHTALDVVRTNVGPGEYDLTLSVEVTAGTVHPDGRVVFFDGRRRVGSAMLEDGAATFTIHDATPGVHRFIAVFAAHNPFQYAGSQSHTVSVVVPKPPKGAASVPATSNMHVGARQRGWTVTTADFRSPLQAVDDGALLATPTSTGATLSGPVMALLGGIALMSMAAFVRYGRRPKARHIVERRMPGGMHRKD